MTELWADENDSKFIPKNNSFFHQSRNGANQNEEWWIPNIFGDKVCQGHCLEHVIVRIWLIILVLWKILFELSWDKIPSVTKKYFIKFFSELLKVDWVIYTMGGIEFIEWLNAPQRILAMYVPIYFLWLPDFESFRYEKNTNFEFTVQLCSVCISLLSHGHKLHVLHFWDYLLINFL